MRRAWSGLVAAGDRTTEELLHDLHIHHRVSIDADGTVTTWKGAELIDGESADEVTADEDRGELDAATLPLVDPTLVELMDALDSTSGGSGDTGSAEELELVLSLDQGDWNPIVSVEDELFTAMLEDHSTAACTVRQPAAALGVFTVGADHPNSSDVEITATNQSRGGGWFDTGSLYVDDGRTLLDLQGPTQHEYAYAEDSTYFDQYPGDMDATSGATPTVAGAAALFRDWYLDERGTAIDSPGLLYAKLLLMGDRIDETGSYLDTGFDELTGAGKLRLRRFDYLDEPADYDDGTLCVDDGTTYTIVIEDDDLDADVDMIKAVIWWYDHRHDSGSRHDKVDLRMQRYDPLLATWTTVRTSDTDDNKQRVYLDALHTTDYRLRITGRDVTSDSEGCGTDSTRVCYAWMFEDQDRDTGTDFDDQIRPEE